MGPLVGRRGGVADTPASTGREGAPLAVPGQEEAAAHGDQAAADRHANGRTRPVGPVADEMAVLGPLLARVDPLPGEVAGQQWVHRVLLGVER